MPNDAKIANDDVLWNISWFIQCWTELDGKLHNTREHGS